MGRFDHVPRALARPRRHARCFHQRRPAPRQAAVVRHRAAGPGGVRAAGQPGLDAGLPGALRRAGAATRRWARARRRRRRSRSAPPFASRPALAYFLPVQLDRARRWARVALPKPTQRLGRLHLAARHRRLRRAAARARRLSDGPRDPPLSLVRPCRRRSPRRQARTARLPRLRAPRDTARPAAARPAHLGDGPLQLPLPVLHAAGDLPRRATASCSSAERLSFDEIVRLARLFVAARRAQAAPHRRRAAAARRASPTSSATSPTIDGVEDIALTTNGVLLAKHAAELKAAGLHARDRQPRQRSTRTCSRR